VPLARNHLDFLERLHPSQSESFKLLTSRPLTHTCLAFVAFRTLPSGRRQLNYCSLSIYELFNRNRPTITVIMPITQLIRAMVATTTSDRIGDRMHDSGALMSNDRLFKIDQLRERNIGKYLPLPQLVAVGDQSSGKSSLLESVTGIPFPHGQELCTRYATQITHRRDTNSFISITIIPGPQASADHKNRVEGYHYEVESTAQLQAEFPDILNKVSNQTCQARIKFPKFGLNWLVHR